MYPQARHILLHLLKVDFPARGIATIWRLVARDSFERAKTITFPSVCGLKHLLATNLRTSKVLPVRIGAQLQNELNSLKKPPPPTFSSKLGKPRADCAILEERLGQAHRNQGDAVPDAIGCRSCNWKTPTFH